MLVQRMRSTVRGSRLSSAALLAAATFLNSACSSETSSYVSTKPVEQSLSPRLLVTPVPPASATTILADTAETCPDGLVLLMKSTISQTLEFKESYHREADGCYITKQIDGNTIIARSFFGALHAREVKNPDVVEAGFRSILLNNNKSASFSVQTSHSGGPFSADNRLRIEGSSYYIVNNMKFPSTTIGCETIVPGYQLFHSTLTFARIPETDFVFLAQSVADSTYPVWGSERVVDIISLPSHPQSVQVTHD